VTRAAPAAFPLLSNLQSLAFGAAKGLGHVGTAAADYVDDIVSPIFLKTGATVSADGIIVLFVVTAEELGHFTDLIDPDATTTQHAKISDATQSQVVSVLGQGPNPIAANTSYCFPAWSVYELLGFKPTFWAPFVRNRSGGALSATAGDFYGVHTTLT
jgi:hypothetical protein